MHLIDEIHLEDTCLGSRGMKSALKRMGYKVGRINVRTLMRKMGIEAIYKKPHPEHKVYPYLLQGHDITESNTVW
jgi:putative transposase